MSKWDDPEFRRAYERKRYRENRDRILKWQAEYYRSNPERRRKKAESCKAWRERMGPDGMREYWRNDYHRNKEKRREQAAKRRRQRPHKELARLMASWR